MTTIGPALPSDTYPLRLAVLAPGGALGMTDAEAAPPALHLAARDDAGRVIGSMHLAPRACPWRPDARAAWQLRTMATDPAARGTGAGIALVEDGLERLRAAGADLVWCNARATAEGFYLRLGFATVSEPFVEGDSGLDHVGMLRAP